MKETIGGITGEDGRFSANVLWKQTRKVFPKNKESIPMALEDIHGNLVTNYNCIKKLALDSIVERLRKRPMHPNLRTLEKARTRLTKLRLQIVTRRKSQPWKMNEMEKAIKAMKNKKCRDSTGLINELFKPGVAGSDFKLSLLLMLNKCKESLEIPQMMTHVNIALIPKSGKKNLRDISNHRGIFLIHKYRSLIMKMLLDDNYNTLDNYMSDSQVGGRKDRGIRDHLFIINGIIHEHFKSKTNPISIQIMDYSCCFDSLWRMR